MIGQRGSKSYIVTVDLHEHEHLVAIAVNRIIHIGWPIGQAADFTSSHLRLTLLVEHQPVMLASRPSPDFLCNASRSFAHLSHIRNR